MNSWSSETRHRLIVLVIGTAGVLALIWFFLVDSLRTGLRVRSDRIVAVQKQLQLTRAGIKQAASFNDVIQRAGKVLEAYEARMAQGDLYRWVINSLREIQKPYNVQITSFAPPTVGQVGIPPKVPYRAGTYSISGTAGYHDFGTFLAAVENSSPFIRLKSLSLEGDGSGQADAEEDGLLTFRVEFNTLIRSASPR